MDVRKGPEGFTLLELLVAMAIFAAVIAMVYGAYRSTFRITGDSEGKLQTGTMARVALDRISEDLETVYTGKGGYLQGVREENATGRADRLVFTSTSHLRFSGEEQSAGYALLGYSLEKDGDSGLFRLYRADVPALPGGEENPDEEWKGYEICTGLVGFQIDYMDEHGVASDEWQSHDEAPGWSDALGPGRYPALVRVTLQFAASAEDAERVSYSTAVALPAAVAVNP